MHDAVINVNISAEEVPVLRESVGWDKRETDYPLLFERCTFWVGIRNAEGLLIGFGYLTGMGLQHGYVEDIIVHPDYQQLGIGTKLVKTLIGEAERRGIEIVTVTYRAEHTGFYEKCGFTQCNGGIWRK
ncbi:GNAT family N-acetyltransferase [Sporosarcina sp. Te-1]|uniref:GNAT family N-acetyltransferase n=1 Tax=Sporosarcina sp. Te-1 TaxID=2818390 RepID=UPI001A9F50A3|nr:GNAT family N-acetyltransferase [Sporosarcina sp. Te-1]QTD40478.1 GNAT family N-acetyltransferase [Sporosarcina sp. Te-1]